MHTIICTSLITDEVPVSVYSSDLLKVSSCPHKSIRKNLCCRISPDAALLVHPMFRTSLVQRFVICFIIAGSVGFVKQKNGNMRECAMHRRNAYHAFRTFKFGMRDVGNAYYAFRVIHAFRAYRGYHAFRNIHIRQYNIPRTFDNLHRGKK